MAKILFSDKASTTMSGSLASGLGTLNVAPGGGARFPAPTGGDFFYATLYQKDGGGAEINIEVVKITAKPSADSFTISERDVTNITGYGGGYAYPGAAGTVYVELRWLEKAATAMMQAADMTAANVSFTPAGNVAASNLQAAVQELDTEKAPLASPALTGTPTAPTAGAGTSTTQLATTAFVSSAIGVHNGVVGAHGVSGSVVGTTDTQTLTNKTIVAASNTITTAASGNLTSTNLNAALAELQGDIDTRATSSSLSSHTGATSAHGVAGNVVGTTDTQTLQNKTLDSTNTFNGNVSGASGHLAGFRNKIINGDMRIAQRGSSFPAIATGAYSLDRWAINYLSAAAVTVEQGTAVLNEFPFQYQSTVTTADTSIGTTDRMVINQRIEGFNARDLIGRDFTLSFWVRSSKTGVHCVAFQNSGSDRSYVAEFTVNTANTWEKKSITVSGGLITSGTWNWTSGLGLFVSWALAAGSSFHTTANAWQTGNFLATTNQVNCLDTVGNIFAITGVQLEAGSIATPFEHRPYGLELALCQRYYEAQPTARSLGFPCPSTGGFAHVFEIKWAVQKRANPNCLWTIGSLVNVASYSAISQTPDCVTIQVVGNNPANTTFIVSDVSASAEL